MRNSSIIDLPVGSLKETHSLKVVLSINPFLEIKDNILDGTMLNPLYTLTLSRSNREVSEELK